MRIRLCSAAAASASAPVAAAPFSAADPSCAAAAPSWIALTSRLAAPASTLTPASAPTPAPHPGDAVVLAGLVSAPELNGSTGTIMKYEGTPVRLPVQVGAKSLLIKPQNLLVDGKTHSLKLCDFGSAK